MTNFDLIGWLRQRANIIESDPVVCMKLDQAAGELERLKEKLIEVERLAANNVTGCGTCTTIIQAVKGVVEPQSGGCIHCGDDH